MCIFLSEIQYLLQWPRSRDPCQVKRGGGSRGEVLLCGGTSAVQYPAPRCLPDTLERVPSFSPSCVWTIWMISQERRCKGQDKKRECTFDCGGTTAELRDRMQPQIWKWPCSTVLRDQQGIYTCGPVFVQSRLHESVTHSLVVLCFRCQTQYAPECPLLEVTDWETTVMLRVLLSGFP